MLGFYRMPCLIRSGKVPAALRLLGARMGMSQLRRNQVTLLWTFNSLLLGVSSPLLTFTAEQTQCPLTSLPRQRPPGRGRPIILTLTSTHRLCFI